MVVLVIGGASPGMTNVCVGKAAEPLSGREKYELPELVADGSIEKRGLPNWTWKCYSNRPMKTA